ncbi:MAG: CBS domain-containing protein [Alphaproteobacteria bacterium]|nr:CBS domain-containing protein [Alphaproteobacteria bacterium]
MLARDVMTREVCAVFPHTHLQNLALMLVDTGISAVPVIDDKGKLLGIVSEGDLLRRREIGTSKRMSWWDVILSDPSEQARDYAKSHGTTAQHIMTTSVVTITEETPLAKIAELMEAKRVKRMPVVRDGFVVGIVSRRDLVRALVSKLKKQGPSDDKSIRNTIEQRLKSEIWVARSFVSYSVEHGEVALWGLVTTADQKKALRVLMETVPGVTKVSDELVVQPQFPMAV